MAKDLNKQPLDFKSMIAQGAEMWRGRYEELDKMEKLAAAEENPVALVEMARTAWRSVLDRRRSLRRDLRDQFGIEVMPASWLPDKKELSFPPIRIVDKERARPKTLLDVARLHDLQFGYALFEGLWWVMKHEIEEAYQAWQIMQPNLPTSYPAQAGLFAYFCIMRNAPIISAPLVSRSEGPPGQKRLQEAATGMLSSWVRSNIKLYESIRAALAEEGDPQEVLLEQLPGAFLAELDKLKEPGIFLAELDKLTIDKVTMLDSRSFGVYKVLVNRVANHLRKSGSEEKDLLRQGAKLAEPEADVDIEAWELGETARQQLDALEQTAGLSPQQTEVWKRSRSGMKIAKIATELGIPENQVSVQKHNAIEKLKEARKAAGF